MSAGEDLEAWLRSRAGDRISGRHLLLSGNRLEESSAGEVVPLESFNHGGQAGVARGIWKRPAGAKTGVALRAEFERQDDRSRKRRIAMMRIANARGSDPVIAAGTVETFTTLRVAVGSRELYGEGALPGHLPVLVDVMEWAPSLRAVLPRRTWGNRPVEAVDLALPLMRALERVHSQFGYVHRDIDDVNVLMGAGGVLRLTDWGIATQLAPGETHRVTEVWRKPNSAWVAPEVRDGMPGKFTDAWSVGCLLVLLATGSAPFLREGPERIFEMGAAVNGLPRPLRVTIGRLLTPDRYARMPLEEAIADLDAWAKAERIPKRPKPEPKPGPKPAPKPPASDGPRPTGRTDRKRRAAAGPGRTLGNQQKKPQQRSGRERWPLGVRLRVASVVLLFMVAAGGAGYAILSEYRNAGVEDPHKVGDNADVLERTSVEGAEGVSVKTNVSEPRFRWQMGRLTATVRFSRVTAIDGAASGDDAIVSPCSLASLKVPAAGGVYLMVEGPASAKIDDAVIVGGMPLAWGPVGEGEKWPDGELQARPAACRMYGVGGRSKEFGPPTTLEVDAKHGWRASQSTAGTGAGSFTFVVPARGAKAPASGPGSAIAAESRKFKGEYAGRLIGVCVLSSDEKWFCHPYPDRLD